MQCAPSRHNRQHTACLTDDELRSLSSPIRLEDVRNMYPRAFRPRAPKSWVDKPNAWLSNMDIDSVLYQYEEVDPTFSFMGTFPLDFAVAVKPNGQCMFNDMCSFAVAQLPPNKYKFAIVINTDTHDKSGRHWIALFCRLDRGIYFFDSYGRKPPKLVRDFMLRVAVDMKPSVPNFQVEYNSRRIQMQDTECGVFCVVFVVRMLMEAELGFKRICETMEEDADIQKYRSIMWNR